MYCEKCGKQISDQSEYCIYCGKKVVKLTEPVRKDPPPFHGWYYNLNGTKGPFTRQEMTQFLSTEVIRPKTMVQPPDSSEWCRFEDTELYREIISTVIQVSRERQLKCIVVGICASIIGALMFAKWFDLYFTNISIIGLLKWMGDEVTFPMKILALMAGINLVLCIFTVVLAIKDQELFMGPGIGSGLTFITSLYMAHSEEVRLAAAPYFVLVLGIVIIIFCTVNIELQQVYQRFK